MFTYLVNDDDDDDDDDVGLNVLRCRAHKLGFEDVPLVEFMYLVFTRVPVRVTVGDSSLCCCICVTYFQR